MSWVSCCGDNPAQAGSGDPCGGGLIQSNWLCQQFSSAFSAKSSTDQTNCAASFVVIDAKWRRNRPSARDLLLRSGCGHERQRDRYEHCTDEALLMQQIALIEDAADK